MEAILGLLQVRVVRGIKLVKRDILASDPYVVLRAGDRKVKTSVWKSSLNPQWNEILTLTVSEPVYPIELQVFDKDTFTPDDFMGEAVIDIYPLIEAARMDLDGTADGTIIRTLNPRRNVNCFAEDSHITWKDGTVTQDAIVRLRNVESSEVQLQLSLVKASHVKTIYEISSSSML